MNDVEKLIASCRDGDQADRLTKDKDELDRARRALSELKKDEL